MIKAVLDANIFVGSAIRERGVAAAVIGAAKEGKYELVTSPDIRSEIKRALSYPEVKFKSGWTFARINRFIEKLQRESTNTPGILDLQVIQNDTTDDKYIIAAVEAGADYVVSRDPHLLDLKEYEGIQIISPEVFLLCLRSKPVLIF
ncbi:putative toxin-antitoxin system toxin component, PIN family [Candidatus Poribacteria bacterium]|nr:putative toxin-antitoxin system toxin component, PIN family [Candidatus Poribacteria bacterium]